MHWNKHLLWAVPYLRKEGQFMYKTSGHGPEAAHGHAEAAPHAPEVEKHAEKPKKVQAEVRSDISHALPANEQGHEHWGSTEGEEVPLEHATKEVVSVAAAGTAAGALTQIATASGLPHAVAAGGTGYVGWKLGRHYLGRHFPYLSGPIGAAGGIAVAPAIPAVVQGVGSFLSGIGAPGAGNLVTLASGIAALGGAAGGIYIAEKMGIKNVYAKYAGGGIVGAAAGSYLGTYLTPALTPLLPAIHAVGGQLTALGTSLVGYFPALGTTTGALSSSLGTGGAIAALYGMGWLNGKLNNYGNTGFVGNLWRGVTLLPYGLPKYLLGKGAVGVRNAVTGNNKLVKGITSPIWWPIRTALRPVLGLGEGLYSGATGHEASDRYHAKGITGSIGRGIGSTITSPIWGTKKLVNHLLSPASSSSSSSHH